MKNDERKDEAFRYPGGELPLFARCTHWKRYFASHLRSFIAGEVLEVGAGIGANTSILCGSSVRRWLCVEPDETLVRELRKTVSGLRGGIVEVRGGTLLDLPRAPTYDSIVYIDVIEHLANDGHELREAALRLKSAGHLVVLVPAHQELYSEFDRAVGHYRRYSSRTLRAVAPPGVREVSLRYLDSVGLFASLANRAWLKEAQPSVRQIRFWDEVLIRFSRVIDPLLGYQVGKSLIGVWQKS